MGCEFDRVTERGVVPTIKLLQGEWIGVDLSNYFRIYEEKIEILENSLFNFKITKDSLWIRASRDVKGFKPISLRIGKSKFILMTETEAVNHKKFEYTIDALSLNDAYLDTNKIFVMGNFNNWNRTSHPLRFDGIRWSLTLSFPPGDYEYKFVVNGEELLDPQNKHFKANGLGGYNSIFSFNRTVSNELRLRKHRWVNNSNKLHFIIQNENKDSLIHEIMINNQKLSPSHFKWIENNEQPSISELSVNLNNLDDGVLRIYSHEYGSGQRFLENQTIIKSKKPLTPEVDKNNFYFKGFVFNDD